jgi:hypothetical protein
MRFAYEEHGVLCRTNRSSCWGLLALITQWYVQEEASEAMKDSLRVESTHTT